MNRKDQYIEPDNTFYEPSRDTSSGTMMLVVIVTILSVILTSVLALIYFKQKNNPNPEKQGVLGDTDTYISVATSTPTPVPPMNSNQNPLLYPSTARIFVDPDAVVPTENLPSYRGITQNVTNGAVIVTDYVRPNLIFMPDPLDYSNIAGITTYRGNNFRNTATYGYTNPDDYVPGNSDIRLDTLTQVWEFSGMHSLLASSQTFEWTGVQQTGQPLVVRWPTELRNQMNMYDSKRVKDGLVEVIVAGLDGYVYFFDIDDGQMTRDPLYVGASIKGTPAIDPRGYPLLYLGQADNNGNDGFGMYIYSLINCQRLFMYNGLDDGAYRMNWSAFDSSPIVDGATDTLIWPCENGIIYTFTLNTTYVPGSGTISISPTCTGYKYIFTDTQGRYLGVESSVAVYGNLAYFVDNNSNLICLDLNTMQMVWVFRTGDDSDISPVLSEENGVPYLYFATEVDYQGGSGQYSGAAYTYKLNALTGEEVWQTSQPCYTYNGETSDTDQNGGCIGNPILGKGPISNLVIFSYSMTNGLMSGNLLVAYNRDTGTEAWRYEMNIYTYSSPVDLYDQNGNAYVVICDSLGQIHLVDATNGYRIAYIQASSNTFSGTEFQASPVVFENMLVISTTQGSVFGIRID